ncbi:MAG: STAS domain-containing protein [candidate division Zixibacteria bacterium]|nr:STAS domain-containing protein [candidate division Zixibacteria bacterium]
MENISISLSEGGRDREVSEVRIDGVIDTLTASELEQVFDSLLGRNRYRIVVDLAGVDYISSAGWGIFISHIKDVRDNDGDVKLAGMVPDVREIFELLEFDKVLQSFASVDEAASKFSNTGPGGSSKKKEATKVEIIEDLDSSSDQRHSDPPADMFGPETNLEMFALKMLKGDPFVTIGEIRREFATQTLGLKAGWWAVFKVLKRHRLLRQRSRFQYAWGRA